MRVKLRNENVAQRTPHSYDCATCSFSLQPVVFCIKVNCNGDAGFDDVEGSEDIFKL